MKDLDTMTVSKVGQSTLPRWWRETSGLSKGGLVEVRPMRDGKNSIVLTPKPAKRRGAMGLLKLFSSCPAPIAPPERHRLPFK
jgi:bifunctional DNA-binding transcriptional regulator/antitoxin component of YhaV-PrlF toxin-antitoxin module